MLLEEGSTTFSFRREESMKESSNPLLERKKSVASTRIDEREIES